MNTKSFLSILAVVVVALAGGVYIYAKPSTVEVANVATSASASVGVPVATPISPETQTTIVLYKDGTYAAKGSYRAPSGEEIIDVSVTLKDGVITDSSVVGHGTSPGSKVNQADFIANYKQLVTGKKINEVQLTKVSGSSLTSTGWNSAIEHIQSQAKA